jgi:nitrogen fixation protein FixH
MDDKLARLGWQIEVSGLAGVHAGSPAPVAVRIVDGNGRPVEAVEVAMELNRPGQGVQARLLLTGGTDGYHGTLAGLQAGTWVANLHLRKGRDKVALEHTLEVR